MPARATRLLVALLLLFAAFSFALGITMPIVRFEKLYFFKDEPSLLDLFAALWIGRDWLVAFAILLFSILFPLLKLGVTFVAAIAPKDDPKAGTIGSWVGVLSKWSMMDVLLVAIVIFAAKSSGLAQAASQPGLWFYAASAVSGACAAALLRREQTAWTSRRNQASRLEEL